MGLGPRLSSCGITPTASKPLASIIEKLPNPDPNNFRIVNWYTTGRMTAVKVNYPDCTNFEGNKILVFNASLRKVLDAKELDPHFCEDGHLSPFARFEPTDEGWTAAKNYVAEHYN